MSNDPHVIRTQEGLREIVGPEIPGLAEKCLETLDGYATDFLARAPFVIVATADASGNLDASPKGDGPGFIHIEDERTLVIPDRPGNKLVFGHQNILENPKVGLIFMIPGTPETLRVNGSAELTTDPDLLEKLAARGRPAVLAIRVTVEQAFFHCAKAFKRSKLWEPESWGERHRVSFGEMYAKRAGGDDQMAKLVDEAVEADYRENL